MNSILFSQIALDDIISQLRTVVKDELNTKRDDDLNAKFLSPAETCALFQPQISLVTLASWTKSARLIAYRIGGRVYYKHSEVIEAVTLLKKYKKTIPNL